MTRALKLAAGLPALIFILYGLSWLIVPDTASQQLGMSLLAEIGLSSQIGDLASFFLTLGTCILIGVSTSNRIWLYPAIMLLSFAMAGRIIAWLFHGAALPIDMIAVEAVIISLLGFVSRKLSPVTQASSSSP